MFLSRNVISAIVASLLLLPGMADAKPAVPATPSRSAGPSGPGSRFHVEVRDGGDVVKIQIPVRVARIAVRAFLPADAAHVSLDSEDVSKASLREMWAALEDSNEDIVTVDTDDGRVRIRRDGGMVRIEVEETSRGQQETVRVSVPASAMDELLSGEEDTLDVKAAIGSVLASYSGELVHVDGPDANVRIWID